VPLDSPFTNSPDAPGWHADAVLRDYRLACRSRQLSLVARKEVFAGRAKFGIFGEGKECAQLAMAYAFRKGDFRSGYYRDQTLMFALGVLTPDQFFAQLYAHADVAAEPASGGRQMTGHFATRLLDDEGRFLRQTDRYNSAADLSPTASQMPRLVGLAYASKLYRQSPRLSAHAKDFTSNGDEIVFGTIGESSCAEGLFWESVNAIGVLQVPALLSIWDDGFGISVPNAFQMTKGDIGRTLEGFGRRVGGRPGIALHVARGWDYPALCSTYLDAAEQVRRTHTPAIVHVTELTQPAGHSTSGNHERYKSTERLAWEKEYDCLPRMRAWILEHQFATAEDLDRLEAEERQLALQVRDRAWDAYRTPIEHERTTALALFSALAERSAHAAQIRRVAADLETTQPPLRRHIMAAVGDVLLAARHEPPDATRALQQWKQEQDAANERRYGSHLYSESAESALAVPVVPARYASDPPMRLGFEVMQACFDAALQRIPQLVAMGEDVGRLGGVNQGWAHLQEKHGGDRITDTGIREATIVGQAIGMAMRGLRPIAEVQYLDYLLYALQIIADDLATLRWRTAGGQKAPVIISTRGHRLEGVWHSGSPMAGIVNLVRGVYVCVPRDAVQAAGFYNTVLQSDDAAIIVEVLNGYRKRLPMPDNIGEFTVPLGVPDIIRPGSDVTVVTYGACCDIAMEAAALLQEADIDIEVIDVRTLLPFDTPGIIRESLGRTGRVLFVDEDCPGGITAYMMQDVLERQRGFDLLDSPPRTLAARPHRPAYGSDGDYFSKPNRAQIADAVYQMMGESDPRRFPPGTSKGSPDQVW
jgi:pyruvate/2-oxoglutarate/acetoin dehydrogenase E1 component/TPP-dependent pyruvate/acetoin dehydrogenase alpha subunit